MRLSYLQKRKKVKLKQNLLAEEVDFGEWWFEQTDGSTLITFFILKITSYLSHPVITLTVYR